jgi:hypothetical protein
MFEYDDTPTEAIAFHKRALPIFAVICILVYFLTGCGSSTHITTQQCTVEQIEEGALISCPDGTEITLQKEREVATIVTYVPVKQECKKRKKKDD